MNEYAGRPNLPGYVSIKDAARILGISDKRVYAYVNDKRLSSMWAGKVIMIPEEEVFQFKKKSAGRPRQIVPVWRVSAGENVQFTTSIRVEVLAGQQNEFMQKLEEIRSSSQHTFPGTVTRFIVEDEAAPGLVEILLIWKNSIMPEDSERDRAISAFQQAFSDVLNWSTARYTSGKVLMHT